jgi:hypothetical protein
MQNIQNLSDVNQLRLKKECFYFYCLSEDFPNAKILYDEFCKNIDQFVLHDFVSMQMSFFQYGIVFDLPQICEEALSHLKHQKKHSMSQNYNYMKILFHHLKNNEPIYINEQDFKDHQQLLMELKCIRALDYARGNEFKQIWNFLRQSNIQSYSADYKFIGAKCLFSECLKMHKEKIASFDVNSATRNEDSHLLVALLEKLKERGFMNREEIFYFLYGRPAETKEDLHRISKYMYKLKNKANLNITASRGIYKLVS